MNCYMNDFYEIISEIFLEKSRPSLYDPRGYLHGTPGITAVMGCGDHIQPPIPLLRKGVPCHHFGHYYDVFH